MFKKEKLQRFPALLLCAAMLAALLGGCAEEVGPDKPAGGGGGKEEIKEAAPAELLSAALEGTRTDLEERFGASMLAGFSGMAENKALTAMVDVSFPDELGEIAGSITGSAVFDGITGQARADLVISTDDTPLGVYYSPEFMGVSCEKVFGDGTYYGLRPYGFYEQLNGSALAELVDLDMDSVRKLDEILESVPKDVNVFTAPEMDRIFKVLHELIEKVELTTQDTTITRGGRELRGKDYKAVLSSDELADILTQMATAMPDWVLVYGLGTGDDSAAAVSEAAEAIRRSGMETPVTFTVVDGKLLHVSAQYKKDGGTVYLEAEFYGDNGSTLRLTVEPVFSLTLDLAAGVSAEVNAESTTKLDWATDGGLEFITYRGDVTDLCLEGTLTAEEGRVSFDGIWYSGERGDRNPLKISTTPGGQVSVPESMTNITELGARQLYSALMRAVFSLF